MAEYDFLSVSNGSGDAALMTIQSDRLTGAATIDVNSVVNVPTKFIGTYGSLLPSGLISPSDKRDFRGHVSGADLIIDAFEAGNTDAGNTAGQVVVIKPNTGWANRVATWVKNASGNGTPEAGTFAALTAAAITAVSITLSGNATVTGNVAVTGTVRSTPRVSATTSTATLTPNIDSYAVYDLTAQAADLTIANPTGTARNGDVLIIRIKDNGTSRAITYGTNFVNVSGLDSLAATTISKWHTIGVLYNSAVTKWQIVSISTEA